jgi:hypothetical protein
MDAIADCSSCLRKTNQSTVQTTSPLDLPQENNSDVTASTGAPAESMIECPHSVDVLMPIEGYRRWAGNIYFMSLIHQNQSVLLQADHRSDQLRIVREVIHAVQQDPVGGRFLRAVQIPWNNHDQLSQVTVPGFKNCIIISKTVWEVMKEIDVLIQVGKMLRSKNATEEKTLRRTERKNRRRERHAHLHQSVIYTKAKATVAPLKGDNDGNDTDEEQIQEQILPSSLGILQGLYYVPSYCPHGKAESANGYDDDDSVSSSEATTSPVEDATTNDMIRKKPMITKKRRIEHVTGKDVIPPPAKHARKNITKKSAWDGTKEKCAAASAAVVTDNTVITHKPQPMKSQQAVIHQEGHDANLPKGVTVRPSGKWVRPSCWLTRAIISSQNVMCHFIVFVWPHVFHFVVGNKASSNIFRRAIKICGCI